MKELMIDYPQVFQMFCTKDELRPVMMTPFKQKGYYWATDAHILIRLPITEADLPFEERDKPDAASVFPSHKTEAIKIDVQKCLSELGRHEEFTNELEYTNCKNCDGDGFLECDLGHEHECEKCKGDGKIGKLTGKKIPKQYHAELMGIMYGSVKLFTVLKACELMGESVITRIHRAELQANVFEVGAAHILIMPMRNDYYGDRNTIHKLENTEANPR